jgi:hypothetical protein
MMRTYEYKNPKTHREIDLFWKCKIMFQFELDPTETKTTKNTTSTMYLYRDSHEKYKKHYKD